MAKKLDEIFSPERLRRSWKQRDSERLEGTEPSAPAAAPADALAVFERLQRLIRQRFHVEQGGAMQVLLSELQKLLHQRFGLTAENEASEAERDDLNASIEALLITVEDLAEALELQTTTDRP